MWVARVAVFVLALRAIADARRNTRFTNTHGVRFTNRVGTHRRITCLNKAFAWSRFKFQTSFTAKSKSNEKSQALFEFLSAWLFAVLFRDHRVSSHLICLSLKEGMPATSAFYVANACCAKSGARRSGAVLQFSSWNFATGKITISSLTRLKFRGCSGFVCAQPRNICATFIRMVHYVRWSLERR